MSRERWLAQSAKGFWFYVLNKGVVQLGLGGGVFILSLQYWQDNNFSFEQMHFSEWISDYIIWTPAALVIGLFISILVWTQFEEKYGVKQK